MCFDGKTGGFALLKWDLLGIEMTRQHFRLFSSLELDSHKIWFRQNWVRFVLCQKIINMAHWSIFAFSFEKLHLCKPFWRIYSYITWLIFAFSISVWFGPKAFDGWQLFLSLPIHPSYTTCKDCLQTVFHVMPFSNIWGSFKKELSHCIAALAWLIHICGEEK